MLQRVPPEWLTWIHTKYESARIHCSMKKGAAPKQLVETLVSHGMMEDAARELVEHTRDDGKLWAAKTFADFSKTYLYVYK